jgi:hypothetical protein
MKRQTISAQWHTKAWQDFCVMIAQDWRFFRTSCRHETGNERLRPLPASLDAGKSCVESAQTVV